MAPKKKDNQEQNQDIDTLDSVIAEQKKQGYVYGDRSGEQIKPQDIITTGSFEFDARLGGGFRASSWARFFAEPELGKTSMGLSWGANWQRKYPEDGFFIYFNAEGRITKDLIDRSGLITTPDKFRIVDGNSYEATLNIIERCIISNKENRRYFFMMDSTDAFERAVDKGKTFGDAEKISGGAAIMSQAARRLSILTNLSGHFIFICSQVRDKMKQGPAGGMGGGGKAPSGGNAVKFASSLTGEIRKPWGKRWLRENPSNDKSRIIGRLIEIRLDKTPNETTGTTVYYPVKYGLKGGVWRAYEAFMVGQACGIVKSKGAWYEIEESMYEDMKSNSINVPQKTQGSKDMRDIFDNNPDLTNYTLEKAKLIYTADCWYNLGEDEKEG